MPVSTLHRLDKILLPSSVTLAQIDNARWSSELETLIERPAGHPHPMFVAVANQNPMVAFTTTQLATLLGAVGVGGGSLAATDTFFKKVAVTGNDSRASTTHKRLRINSSCIYWQSVRLPHNGRGTADVTIVANYDGSNEPFVYTGTVALNGNITFTELFCAGPWSINGSDIPCIKNVTINSGVRILSEGGSGEVWPTFVGLEETEPTIDIETKELVNWNTYGLDGIALDGSVGVTGFARKFNGDSNGGTARVANATTEHIKFVGAFGLAAPLDSSGDGRGTISDNIRLVCRANSDSTLPLTITTGSAIS